ncbi:MAG: alpha-L-arabinofuranosidase C-terminal domain-containing protein, partial [Phycisphaerae bacterium]
VVNLDEWPVSAEISFDGFKAETASITQLQGELDARNTAENPEAIVPETSTAKLQAGAMKHSFPAYSVTIIDLT